MTTARARAPAKINLTLHVTGLRADGYHLLDSLVVFADVVDHLTAASADELTLSVSGPFSVGVPADHNNLVLRAAEKLRRIRGVTQGAELTLEKHLPHAAGIGSGSSDAAAALDMLARLWGVEPLPYDHPAVAELGADVPVCLCAPQPMRMGGIGDVLSPAPQLPECAMVLVNPKVGVPTMDVFRNLRNKQNPPMFAPPFGTDFAGFSAWLRAQRNDLEAPAAEIAPDIQRVLDRLSKAPLVAAAGMSGSGATCFGLVRTMSDARHVARAIQVAEMGWWVAPAQVMRATT